MNIVTAILEILLAGLTETAQKMGAGINAFITNLFVTVGESATSLTIFGQVALAFMGVSLALGLCYAILNYVTSMGSGRL